MRPSTLWLSLALLCTQAGCKSCGNDNTPPVNPGTTAAPAVSTPDINTNQPGAAAVVRPSPTPGERLMAAPVQQRSPRRPNYELMPPPPPPAASPEVDTDKPGAAAHNVPGAPSRPASGVQVAEVPAATNANNDQRLRAINNARRRATEVLGETGARPTRTRRRGGN
jgi:hypothetical protein